MSSIWSFKYTEEPNFKNSMQNITQLESAITLTQ